MKTFNGIWDFALKNLLLNGQNHKSRAGDSLEILGWSATLDDLNYSFLTNPRRKLSPIYGVAELLWYMHRTPNIDMISTYAPQYSDLIGGNSIAYGAYGPRFSYNKNDLFTKIINLLQKQPETRQCVLSIFHPVDLIAGYNNQADIPCTLTWQFLIRNNKLHMVCSMRSNDVWLGMPYDVFVNTCIQRIFANTLQIEVGTYTHHVGSLHLYTKYIKAAEEAVQQIVDPLPHNWTYNIQDTLDYIPQILSVEQEFRFNRIGDVPKIGLMFQDFMYIIQNYWTKELVSLCSGSLK